MISFPSSGGKVRGENLVGEEINTKLENLFRVFKLTFTEGKALVNLSNSPDESMSYSLMDIINKETKGMASVENYCLVLDLSDEEKYPSNKKISDLEKIQGKIKMTIVRKLTNEKKHYEKNKNESDKKITSRLSSMLGKEFEYKNYGFLTEVENSIGIVKLANDISSENYKTKIAGIVVLDNKGAVKDLEQLNYSQMEKLIINRGRVIFFKSALEEHPKLITELESKAREFREIIKDKKDMLIPQVIKNRSNFPKNKTQSF